MSTGLEKSPSLISLVGETLTRLTTLLDSLTNPSNRFQHDIRIMLGYESRRFRGWAEALGLGKEDELLQLLNQFTMLVTQLELLQSPLQRHDAGSSGEDQQQGKAILLVHRMSYICSQLHEVLPTVQYQQLADELRLLKFNEISSMTDLGCEEKRSAAQPSPHSLDEQNQLWRRIKYMELTQVVESPQAQISLPPVSEMVQAPLLRKKLLVARESEVNVFSKRSPREMAMYEGQRVFVEWKQYDAEKNVGREGMEISARIQNLATLLHASKPTSFRALDCLGYFEDDNTDRYCFVYKLPPGAHARKHPTSLLSYWASRWRPSLSSRVKLGKELANCLLDLHTAGWLHKSFCSENIVFFSKAEQPPRTLEKPFLVGFEYARRAGPDEFSEGIAADPIADLYRHPRCHEFPTTRFNRRFEYYSLGIVLLEIAWCTPISKIVGAQIPTHKRDITSEQIQKLREILLSSSNPNFEMDLAHRMGERYKNATFACIRGDFGIEGGGDAKVQDEPQLDEFFKEVVQELEGCSI